jgi:hypothetical protein
MPYHLFVHRYRFVLGGLSSDFGSVGAVLRQVAVFLNLVQFCVLAAELGDACKQRRALLVALRMGGLLDLVANSVQT